MSEEMNKQDLKEPVCCCIESPFTNKEYNEYINKHIDAVGKCYELLTGSRKLHLHDNSKWDLEEYHAYANYFHPTDGSEKRSAKHKKDFKYAWNHHQKENPHHWQYWVLIDGAGDIEALEMPLRFVNEMIADWGAFSLISEDGNEIIKWYDANKDKMILHTETRKVVEFLVPIMARKINEYLGKN